nr:MAG TPA: hypothetical protein [Caudoviricetes sp.]
MCYLINLLLLYLFFQLKNSSHQALIVNIKKVI